MQPWHYPGNAVIPMASTEGLSNDTGRADDTFRGPGGANGAEARDWAEKTRAAVDRARVIQQMRDAFSTPASAGMFARAAAQLEPAASVSPASLVPTAGTLAPAGLTSATEALAARAGISVAGAAGVVAGAAAVAMVPSNTAPAYVVKIMPDLRVTFPYDAPVGEIELRVEGRWRDTGVEAMMTADGISADVAALESRIGPLDKVARGAFINERRNGLGLGTLDALSYRARLALEIDNRPGNWQAHHLVPFDAVDTLTPGLQHVIAATGWTMDGSSNLIALPQDQKTYVANGRTLPMQNGAHPKYSHDVRDMLAPLEGRYQGMSSKELKNELEMVSDYMRGRILELGYHAVVR